MSEPSKDAEHLAKAALAQGEPGEWRHVAAALQELMDERDRMKAERDMKDAAACGWQGRAKAAERQLLNQDALATANVLLKERAEAAEKNRDELQRRLSLETDACIAALASKAQLIREVREFNVPGRFRRLEDILARHEQGTSEHPDTVRLRELVERVKEQCPEGTKLWEHRERVRAEGGRVAMTGTQVLERLHLALVWYVCQGSHNIRIEVHANGWGRS